MPKYMLLMRGNQDNFVSLDEMEQNQIISDHKLFAKELTESRNLLNGAGLSYNSTFLKNAENELLVTQNPFAKSDFQLSGFYLIEAENDEIALSIAKKCPAIKHDESVELIKLGH